jgi:hypothetical protein
VHGGSNVTSNLVNMDEAQKIHATGGPQVTSANGKVNSHFFFSFFVCNPKQKKSFVCDLLLTFAMWAKEFSLARASANLRRFCRAIGTKLSVFFDCLFL